MSIQSVQSSPALYQSEAHSKSSAANHQPAQNVSALPEDKVTISSAAKTKSAGVETDHDNDSQ